MKRFLPVLLIVCVVPACDVSKKNAPPAPSPSKETPALPDFPEEWAERFGKPDEDNSKGGKEPERWLVYQEQQVKVVFRSHDDKPRKWYLNRFENADTGAPIKGAAVAKDMMARRDKQWVGPLPLTREEKASEKERAEKEAESRIEKVTRANYSLVTQGMHIDNVQKILGPGKEVSQSGGFQTLTWQSRTGRTTIITMTFYLGGLKSKAILD